MILSEPSNAKIVILVGICNILLLNLQKKKTKKQNKNQLCACVRWMIFPLLLGRSHMRVYIYVWCKNVFSRRQYKKGDRYNSIVTLPPTPCTLGHFHWPVLSVCLKNSNPSVNQNGGYQSINNNPHPKKKIVGLLTFTYRLFAYFCSIPVLDGPS